MSGTGGDKKPLDSFEHDEHDEPKQIPYRRERTPSIVVQSLGLSFKKDSNITGSIELSGADDEASGSPQDTSETSEPRSSASGCVADDGQTCLAGIDESGHSSVSPRGSQSSLQNSSSSAANPQALTSATSPIRASRPSPLHLAATNRRLSLNIGSLAPRRQSLTVEAISSASFINSAKAEAAAGYPGGGATGSLRNKVALKPGHSLMGWIKLASSAKDLAGTGGRVIEVTPEELAKHDKLEDCWVALKGNVYNVTKYLHYHPGGVDELLRGAGRDATELFNEVHRWVNYESILAKCLIGPYKLDSPLTPVGRAAFRTITSEEGAAANRGAGGRRDPTVAQRPDRRQSIALTVPSPNKYQSLLLNNNSANNLNQVHQPPTYVIMQDKSCIKLKIQDLSALNWIRARHLICDLNDRLELHVSIILSPDWLYRIHLRLDQQVEQVVGTDLALSLASDESSNNNNNNNNNNNHHHNNSTSNKTTITLQLNKMEQAIWNRIGTSLDLNDSLCEMTLADKFFRACRLVKKQRLTHDTYLYEFKLDQTLMYVPIGWHVLLREHCNSEDNSSKQNQANDTNDESKSCTQQEHYYEDTRVYKNYTPVLPSILDNDGLIDESGFMKQLYFIVKIYPDGVLTSKLNQLRLGDKVDISDYQCVDFDIEQAVRSRSFKHWLLLAAGTGITPFCRIISYLTSRHDDDSIESINLVFFNKTQADIILQEQFSNLASRRPKFKVTHVLSQEPSGVASSWQGARGKISKELVARFVDDRSPDEMQMLACGPRAFTQLTKSIASELNLTERLYVFHG